MMQDDDMLDKLEACCAFQALASHSRNDRDANSNLRLRLRPVAADVEAWEWSA